MRGHNRHTPIRLLGLGVAMVLLGSSTSTQVHIDSTFAQHFPIGSGLAGFGLTVYWYEQVTGDSGSGASFGDFEGKTNGVGPVLSCVGQASGQKMVAEFRWMHEFGVEKRLSGDTLFLKAMLFF